jgi:hypothetical protein
MERYMKMKKAELAVLAREAGLKGCGKMTKAQLARALADLSEAVEPMTEKAPASTAFYSERPPLPPHEAAPPDLPVYMGENRICLLPQEPRTAFAYWELGEYHQDEILFQVFSVPGGDQILSRRVEGRLGTYYIHLPRAGMEIESEIGVRGPDGFVTLARSNRIRLPEDTPSEELDTLWMTRRKEYEEIFRLSGGGLEDDDRGSGYGPRGPGVPVSSWAEKGRKGGP